MLWVLLGIFGGLETFGLLGLFLGPAIMAVALAIWRDAAEPATHDNQGFSDQPPPEPQAEAGH